MVKPKVAGNIAGGYNQVYFTLAMMSLAGIVLAFVVKRPVQELDAGE